MTDLRYAASLLVPASLEPGEACEIGFKYRNKDDDTQHHIRSFTISPSWNLDGEVTYTVDRTALPGTEVKVGTVEVDVPRDIGGSQGFQFALEVGDALADDTTYERRWARDFGRIDVADYEEIRLLAAGDEDTATWRGVRSLLENWGFAVETVADESAVTAQFSDDDPPGTVTGVVTPDDDDEIRDLVVAGAESALAEDALPVVFEHAEADRPDLPAETLVIDANPDDPVAFETTAGPMLLALRALEATGQRELAVDWLKDTASRDPRTLLTDWVNVVVFERTGDDAYPDQPGARLETLLARKSTTFGEE
jgi:hypothetical protein